MRRGGVVAAGFAAGMNVHASHAAEETTQIEADGFFTLGRSKSRWWLLSPNREPFFTIGLNHIDPASLRYPENIDIWRSKYGGLEVSEAKLRVSPS